MMRKHTNYLLWKTETKLYIFKIRSHSAPHAILPLFQLLKIYLVISQSGRDSTTILLKNKDLIIFHELTF